MERLRTKMALMKDVDARRAPLQVRFSTVIYLGWSACGERSAPKKTIN